MDEIDEVEKSISLTLSSLNNLISQSELDKITSDSIEVFLKLVEFYCVSKNNDYILNGVIPSRYDCEDFITYLLGETNKY